MSGRYIRQEPYVGDDGIYVPIYEYVPEGTESIYNRILTREMFVEAYEKWIKNAGQNPFVCQDDADDWCDD